MSNFKEIFKFILPVLFFLILGAVTEILNSCNYLFENPIGHISLLRKLSLIHKQMATTVNTDN